MSVIFVSHPFASDPVRHARRVAGIARELALAGHLPLTPQLYLPAFIDEVTERDLALRLCMRLVALSDEVRVYGEPSEGMRLEIAEARRLGITVVASDDDGASALTGQPPPMRTRGRLKGGST